MKLRLESLVPRLKTALRALWGNWLRPLGLLFLIVGPLRSSVLDWNWVPTGSMKPTILEGDLVLVNKVAYDLKFPFTTSHLAEWSDPARGEIVVCYSPADGTRLVKRVVGIPGDTVEMRRGVLFVNGREIALEAEDPEPFRHEIIEDSSPVLSRERLGQEEHWVLQLPHRLALRDFGPYLVATDAYFVLGDSRDNSHDSRFFGLVPRSEILGRAGGVIVSFDLRHFLRPRFTRFASKLD